MRTIRLFLARDYPPVGELLVLPDEAKHYVTTVLRARHGFQLSLFNGEGLSAQATLVLDKKQALVRIDQSTVDTGMESPLSLLLAQGISRGERMDISLQKATELGVKAIQPLFTQYCEVKLEDDDKINKRMAHWRQVIISACEQSGRTVVPELYAPLTLQAWLAQKLEGLVLDPYQGVRLQSLNPSFFQASTPALLIGPEGGLSPLEVTQAIESGMTPVRLGPRILRTETAGPAAIAALQSLFGDA